jgi:hypothetical protein
VTEARVIGGDFVRKINDLYVSCGGVSSTCINRHE